MYVALRIVEIDLAIEVLPTPGNPDKIYSIFV